MAHDQPDSESLRAHFGVELRRLRTRASLSMNGLAKALGCSAQWVYQLEQGDKPVPEQMAFDLDTYFQTDGWEENDGLFHRIHAAIRRAGHHRALRPCFETYRRQEPKAISIRSYSAQLVPGLLQTKDYARGIMDPNESAEINDERVTVRLERQTILSRAKPPEMMFVLDESVFRRPVGGAKVMVDQIEHLVTMAEQPHVQIRIMPFDRVTPSALAGSFILLGFAKDPDLLYNETVSISHLTQDRDVVFKAGIHFHAVMGEALSQTESTEFMRQAREELP